MIPTSSIGSTILSAAGEASKSNAATTMMTTGLGFVRTGMVPLDRKTPKEQKAQVAAWVLASTVLSLVTQLSVYKLLGSFIDNISIKNLRLDKFGAQLKNLKSLPLDDIDKAFKAVEGTGIAHSTSKWAAMRSAILKAVDPSNPRERELVKKLLTNLDDIARQAKFSTTAVPDKFAQQVVNNVKNIKGANQFFMFLFGAALFTGYLIPAFITKYLPNIMQFGHDKIKVNGNSVLPAPKKRPNDEKKKANFVLFGMPLLASGGVLAFLNSHKMDLTKGFGEKFHKAFKAIAKWDYSMNPNARIVRNIFTNAILRPFAALLDGRIFLAVYNFMMETLSAGSLLTTKKFLGGAKNKTGLIGKVIKKCNITNPKHALGVEFMMTHGIQTFLVLGVILGLASTVASRHITNFAKKVLKIKEEEPIKKENEMPAKYVFPAAEKLGNIRSANSSQHHVLSGQFEDFLIKTGYYQQK